ncbi:U11/U12 small nuclear ribonucleoprotein 65 kDa protein isoform X2 [Nymphaea colorata]|uniref:U11/U12 small nuclear ribonucleoprotein 65 kDa protein isoform X2 n=1 Tax=Nymphaea colorata TaxID=210225 RepID=UPI00214DF565|nr:U11/U12 small nuclear ribonucleoprotein 65 kDa protein isoform X2 [Nymphaea colorata]
MERRKVTLIVRHLPEAIPQETLFRLFSHYGACGLRPCAGGKLRNSAFVDFNDEVSALQAQQQLNRLRFLGKVLSVERVNTLTSNEKEMAEKQHRKDAFSPTSTSKELTVPGIVSVPGSTPNAVKIGEPIAPRLGVDYPFPPHLEYAYPPPDGNILTNIVNALIAVPRFYTQVLHLMNKMNLPAPFRAALPTPPFPPSEPAPPPPPPPPPAVAGKPPLADLSSDESELESSDESDIDQKKSGAVFPGKRRNRKKAKHEAIIGPAVDKDVSHEAAGVKPVTLVPKELPTIKKKNPVLQIKIAPKPVKSEKGEANDGSGTLDHDKEEVEVKHFASLQEIETGKLPPEEILSLPMFKNYTPGDPSPVLYIKNLAKDVVADDFYYIFGSFFGSVEAVKSGISIKLMQEGRMRGQAFVTFPSIDLAQQALVSAHMGMFGSGSSSSI